MGWLLSERRGKKQGWMEESLASVSLPPSPLLALIAIVSVLLLFSSYTSYKYQMQRIQTGFNILLFLLPALLISLAHFLIKNGGFPGMSPRMKETVVSQAEGGGGGASPWGVALFLGIMLVLLSKHSWFQSMWGGSYNY